MHTSKNVLNVIARMAELVDALVSKTNEVTLVPVRSRLRVREFNPDQLIFNWLGFFCFMIITVLQQLHFSFGLIMQIASGQTLSNQVACSV